MGAGSGGDEGKFSAAAAAAAAHSHEKLQTSPSPPLLFPSLRSPRVRAYKPKQTSVSLSSAKQNSAVWNKARTALERYDGPLDASALISSSSHVSLGRHCTPLRNNYKENMCM